MTTNKFLGYYCLAFLCFLIFAACSPSNAMTTGADDGAWSTGEAASTPFGRKMKILSVQQFEDRQPIATEDGRPMPPRLITLVNFETMDCGTMRDEDFQVSVTRKGHAALVKISAPAGNGQCAGAEKVQFQVGVPGLQKSEAVVITNPALIDELKATE